VGSSQTYSVASVTVLQATSGPYLRAGQELQPQTL
jgi:hypothetical protein